MTAAAREKIRLVSSNTIRISKPSSFVNKAIEISPKKTVMLVLNLKRWFFP